MTYLITDIGQIYMMQPYSLYRLCQHCVLRSSCLGVILDQINIPTSIHVQLFTEALLHARRKGAKPQYGDSLQHLVSYWPLETLDMVELFPGVKVDGLLSLAVDGSGETYMDGGGCTVLEAIMRGLLNLRSRSRMHKINIGCEPSAILFHLPVLYQPSSPTLWNELIDIITEESETFTREYDDTMESVSSWKLLEMSHSKERLVTDYHGPDKFDIYLENNVCLTEWMAMIDQIIGLCIQKKSPFKFHFTSLVVDEFHIVDSRFLKWILGTGDITVLTKLFIYGNGKSTRLAMWELHEHLSRLPNLVTFGLGNTDPSKMKQIVGPCEPTNCSDRTRCVLNKWNNLQELSLAGVCLYRNMNTWLASLQNSLTILTLYACNLHREDLIALSGCHHLVNIEQLSIGKNNFRYCGRELCDIVRAAPRLGQLNLRETNLQLDEKMDVVVALQDSGRFHTLVMYEQEDMVSTEGYRCLVQNACGIPQLKNFYIFPFNYKPFEVFYRQTIEELSESILLRNERTDIKLYY